MTLAFIAIHATDHPVRDEWVDEQARNFPVDIGLPINDDTYRGVGFGPDPDEPLVHLFALPEDAQALARYGFQWVDL